MCAFAQRVTSTQQHDQPLGQPLNDSDLQCQAGILDLQGEGFALTQKLAGPLREPMYAVTQGRQGPIVAKHFYAGTGRSQSVERM